MEWRYIAMAITFVFIVIAIIRMQRHQVYIILSGLLIIGVFYLPIIRQPEIAGGRENISEEITFKPKGMNRDYKAGVDFKPGRYRITTPDKEDILFIRNSDGEKIVSEVIGANKGHLNSYTITLEEGFRVIPITGDNLTLTRIQDEKFKPIDRLLFTAGIWTNNENFNLKEGKYSVTFEEPGTIYIIDKHGNRTYEVSSEDKRTTVELQKDDTIKVMKSESVLFNLQK